MDPEDSEEIEALKKRMAEENNSVAFNEIVARVNELLDKYRDSRPPHGNDFSAFKFGNFLR